MGYGAGYGVINNAWKLERRLLCCGALAFALMVGTFFIGGFIAFRQTSWTMVELQGTEYIVFHRQGDRLLVAPFSREKSSYEPRFRLLPISEEMTLYRLNIDALGRTGLSTPNAP